MSRSEFRSSVRSDVTDGPAADAVSERRGLQTWAVRIATYAAIGACLWLSAQAATWIYFVLPLRGYTPSAQAAVPQPIPGAERVLVFAPHEDDETLATGGTIDAAVKKGDQVLVVFMTNGDGFWGAESLVQVDFLRRAGEFLDFGRTRQREAVKAISMLGLSPQDALFLGYPDHGLRYLWSDHWSCNELYKSPYTRREASPYTDSLTPRAPFCGAAVLSDVEAIIASFRPTIIYLPSLADEHPDHRATGEFVLQALEDLARDDPLWVHTIELRAYLVHLYHTRWPNPRGLHTDSELAPPPQMEGEFPWVRVALSPQEVQAKLRAIRAYRTQDFVMGTFLSSFIRTDEIYYNVHLDQEPAPIP